MDPKLLADALTNFLVPSLPYLITGSQEAVYRARKIVGEEGVQLAKRLWEKLRTAVAVDPRAQGAAEKAAGAPDDTDARAALRLHLRKLLEADPALASELARMVNAAGREAIYQATVYGSGAVAQGSGAVAAGAGGLAVGGDVKGTIVVSRGRHDD